MNRKACFREAERLTYGERNNTYGSPIPSLGNIARLWSNYKVCPHCGEDVLFYPHDVGLMMILLKISRLRKDHTHLDGYVDAAGWAGCAVETLEGPDYEEEILTVAPDPAGPNAKADLEYYEDED